ncbi:hypothetical protein OIV83_003575 [Microbotryomycetes sp. JL201]|nr:hypothetical protein OIV83_003575 [Microbotryomycetes sp. JL201]
MSSRADDSSLFASDDEYDDDEETTSAPVPAGDTPARLTGAIAVECLERLVNLELKAAGYATADQQALQHLHGLAVVFFEALVQRAHELTEQAARSNVNIKDAIAASVDLGVVTGPMDFIGLSDATRDRNAEAGAPPLRYKRVRPSAVEKTLPSDDEENEQEHAKDKDDVEQYLQQSIIPKVKPRKLPEALTAPYLPQLPPKHTFKQTPVYPQPAAPPTIPNPTYEPRQKPSTEALRHLATLRARFNDSQMVASSLRNLIRKTSVRTVAAQQQNMPTIEPSRAGAGKENVPEVAIGSTNITESPSKDERVVLEQPEQPNGEQTAFGGETAKTEADVDQKMDVDVADDINEPQSASVELQPNDSGLQLAPTEPQPAVAEPRPVANDVQPVAISAQAPVSQDRAIEPVPAVPAATEVPPPEVVDVATAAASLEEEWTDIVDYEGEWYGAATSRWTGKHGRQNDGAGERNAGGVIVLKVGKNGLVDKDDLESNGLGAGASTGQRPLEGVGSRLGSTGWIDAGRVGVASKRRKWRA